MGPELSGQLHVWHGLPRAAGPAETPALCGGGLGLAAEACLLASVFRTEQLEVPWEGHRSSLVSVPLSSPSLSYS